LTSVLSFRISRCCALCGSAVAAALGFANAAAAQTQLPEVVVTAPKEKEKPKPKPVQVRAAPRPAPAPATPAAPPVNQTAVTANTLNQGLNTIYAPMGTAPTTISHDTIQALPQGENATVEKILLQAPGVTQDSAASGSLHVRNEHANVQVRINGIMLPDGVTGFGTFLDTALIGNMTLITGALPAQFGLRTSGVLDIQTRNDAFNGGTVGVYGGTRQTFTPSFEYGGQVGQTQYFPHRAVLREQYRTGKSDAELGGDPRSHDAGARLRLCLDHSRSLHALHADGRRLLRRVSDSEHAGAYTELHGIRRVQFQFCIAEREPIRADVFHGCGMATLDQRRRRAIVLLQPLQHGAFHPRPDRRHRLQWRGLRRLSRIDEPWCDGRYRLQAQRGSHSAWWRPIRDASSLFGYTASLYLQDEWRLTDRLTLNIGLRFDEYWEYITEYQLSPRVSLTWKPFAGTTFHAGYARTFTPPEQVLAAPTNLALFQNTTQQPSVQLDSLVRAERADVYDVGVVQQVLPGLEASIDAYYKHATNLIDDGQFGQAFVLTAFNYAQGENFGVELSTKYKSGPFQAYGNIAVARQIATNPVSKPIPVRQCHAAPRSWRAHRVSVSADALGLYRPLAMGDRIGRSDLSVLRQTGAS
jgi:hypothetical protein